MVLHSSSAKNRYAIIRCPRCDGLQVVRSGVKSHGCSYCNKIIKLEGSTTRTLLLTDSSREASRIVMKLKSKDALDQTSGRPVPKS
jgi:ribosomal protein L37AE/L43A